MGEGNGFLKALVEIEIEQKEHDHRFGLVGPADANLGITPKMVEIIQLLQKNLLLVGPTLQWIQMKEAEMARAQLTVLYSVEELEEMKQKLDQEEQGE